MAMWGQLFDLTILFPGRALIHSRGMVQLGPFGLATLTLGKTEA